MDYVKARRQDGRVVSVSVIIAVGVNADGRRDVVVERIPLASSHQSGGVEVKA